MEIGIVKPINIEEEMKGAYLDYAMSVITARALPDVRDGLKPVQRRILYAMDELGLRHTSPYKKSARIVGEVLGKYHPHGDAPVYESMVRMAQDFSMRYPLVDGQGNFGSVDGDPPAAMRYTEARLAKIAEEMLVDIDKDTVDFVPNFDGSLKEPSVLPARLPNLLVNGSAGIAVGMATNIPPHNLSEVVDATHLIIGRFAQALEGGVPFKVLWSRVQRTATTPEDLAATLKGLTQPLANRVLEEARKQSARPTQEQKLDALVKVLDDMIAVTPDELTAIVKGPDFPTAGIIIGEEGIKNAYATGHGRIVIRARAHVEDIRGGRQQIVVSELPFQVNKAALIEKIAELVRDRRVEGISELRDESDRQGMRIVIELKRDAQARQILNQLYKYTSMQNSFSINMLALVEGQPRVLTLRMLLMQYIRYRREVVTRRTEFELARARHRAHILEGLKIALDNLDEVIATIRRSPDAETARVTLMKRFKLSELQAQAILDMQLRRLAALERKKILDEYAEVLKLIAYLEDLLAKPAKILYLIRDELSELKSKYGDARRTRIMADEKAEFTEEDLIPDQEVTVTLTAKSYVKRLSADAYRLRRGARGADAAATKEDDPVQQVVLANMLDTLLLFTNRGRVFQVRVRDLSDASRQSRGVALATLAQLDEGERVVSIVPVRAFSEGEYFVMVTRGGEIKRVASGEYSAVRSSGLIAMGVSEGDELGWVSLTAGKSEIVIVTQAGQAIRFSEEEVRPSSRTSGGIRAIRLAAGDQVIGASLAQPHAAPSTVSGQALVTISQMGFAKRSPLEDYPVQGRAGGGVRAATTSAKTGPLVAARVVRPGDNLVVTTAEGLVLKVAADDLPSMNRATQGAPLAGVEKGDRVSAVSHVPGRTVADNGQTPPDSGSGGEDKNNRKGLSNMEPASPKTEDPKAGAEGAARASAGRRAAKREAVAEETAAVQEAERIVKESRPKKKTPEASRPAASAGRSADAKSPAKPAKKGAAPAQPAKGSAGRTPKAPVVKEPAPAKKAPAAGDKAPGKKTDSRAEGATQQKTGPKADSAAPKRVAPLSEGQVPTRPSATADKATVSSAKGQVAPTGQAAKPMPSTRTVVTGPKISKTSPPPAPPKGGTFTSTRLVKKSREEESRVEKESLRQPPPARGQSKPVQETLQRWLPLDDLDSAQTRAKTSGARPPKTPPTSVTRPATPSPARRGSSKSEGKSPSLIGSIASKLGGKKEPPKPKGRGR